MAGHQPFLIRDFADTLPRELVPVLDEAFLWDLSELTDDPDLEARVWLKTLRELKKSIIKMKLKKLSSQVVNSDDSAANVDDKIESDVSAMLSKLTNDLRTLEKAEAA